MKNKKLIRIILTALIVSILCIITINSFNNKTNNTSNKNTSKEELLEVWPKENTFSLVGTGDALLHSGVYQAAKTDDGYDFSNIFDECTDYINQFDVKYINQETVFGGGTPQSYPRFNTPKEWGDDMIKAGFNLFSLATNHSMDMGSSGALSHIEYFKNQSNIGYGGMHDSENREFYTNEVNGITYGFLSYTESTNGLPVPSDMPYLVDVYDIELVTKDVEYLKELVDVIIVAMHWGIEYIAEPNENQKKMANELADLDVDIVLGNHPHWTQPIEYIDNTLVVYSMGNFISNQMTLMNDSYYSESVAVGAFVSMDINKTTYEDETSDITVDNIVVELIWNHKDSNNDYLVVPFSKMNETYYSKYMTTYEKHKSRMTMYSDKVYVNPAG